MYYIWKAYLSWKPQHVINQNVAKFKAQIYPAEIMKECIMLTFSIRYFQNTESEVFVKVCLYCTVQCCCIIFDYVLLIMM